MMSKDSYMVGILFRMLSYPPPLHLTFPLYFPPHSPPHHIPSSPPHDSTPNTPQPIPPLSPTCWTLLHEQTAWHLILLIYYIHILLSHLSPFCCHLVLFLFITSRCFLGALISATWNKWSVVSINLTSLNCGVMFSGICIVMVIWYIVYHLRIQAHYRPQKCLSQPKVQGFVRNAFGIINARKRDLLPRVNFVKWKILRKYLKLQIPSDKR